MPTYTFKCNSPLTLIPDENLPDGFDLTDYTEFWAWAYNGNNVELKLLHVKYESDINQIIGDLLNPTSLVVCDITWDPVTGCSLITSPTDIYACDSTVLLNEWGSIVPKEVLVAKGLQLQAEIDIVNTGFEEQLCAPSNGLYSFIIA